MILIKNGTVLTMAGEPIENGQVLVDNGKILEVGERVNAPKDCKVLDAAGGYIMPGIIDAHCHAGLVEDGIGIEGIDENEATDPVTPQLRAIDSLNPYDRSLKEAYESGITCICTGPGSANVIGGTFVVVKTKGKRVDDMIVKNPAAMKVAFGENPKRVYGSKKQSPSTRMATAAILRETLFKAVEYKKAKEKAAKEGKDAPAFNFKLESMLPVLDGTIPLKAHAHRTDDIFTAIRIAKEFNVGLTLDHCTEGQLIVDELAKEGLPAIVGPSFGRRTKIEVQEKSFDTVGVLAKAGVKVAIMTDHPVIPLKYLPMCAGYAVKAGLDEKTALEAITKNPAEILGIADRVGTLEKGKDADIAVFDGNPLDIQSRPRYVLIDGEIAFEE